MLTLEKLVISFYEDLWNRQNLALAEEILSPQLKFTGSLSTQSMNRDEFRQYAANIFASLSNYHCQIEELVERDEVALAKVRFSGFHTGSFLGFAPTHKEVSWLGHGAFKQAEGKLTDIKITSDIAALRAQLRKLEGIS